MGKRYIKGFEVNYQKIAQNIANVADTSDEKVWNASFPVLNYFREEGYSLELGYTGERHAMVVVLAVGSDRGELENKELGTIDKAIEVAMDVLDGPHVWEAC